MAEREAAGAAQWLRAEAAWQAVERARWTLRRLRCMSAGEIAHRLGRAVAMHRERRRLRAGAIPAVPQPEFARAARPWILTPAIVEATACLRAAERILEGRYDVFALRDAALGSHPQWNRDPRTGREAPLLYGKRLDYRNPRLVGDIKYLWEPNRHLHLVTLAQAYDLSGR